MHQPHEILHRRRGTQYHYRFCHPRSPNANGMAASVVARPENSTVFNFFDRRHVSLITIVQDYHLNKLRLAH